MPEVVGAFTRLELHERTDRSVETAYGSRRDLAQQRLEFAVRQLDGIEIRGVFWQEPRCRSRLLDRFPDARDLVDGKVVDHDDIVAFEGRNQTLLDIGAKRLSGHGAFEHHRGGHFVVPQAGHEGDRLPAPQRRETDQPDAARSPPSKPDQISADRGLVDEYQPGGVKHTLLPDPTPPRA